MKRILSLLLMLLLAVSLTACSGKEDTKTDEPPAPAVDGAPSDTTPDVPAASDPQPPIGPAPEVKAESRYVLTYQGCALPANADFAPILGYLGEPASYFEAESCAFEGLDKTYTYDGVEIVTYPDGDVDRISFVRILTSAVSTPEGITIGATPEDVAAAYGEEGASGQQYSYEDGDCILSIIFQDGKAVSVEYTALNDMLG